VTANARATTADAEAETRQRALCADAAPLREGAPGARHSQSRTGSTRTKSRGRSAPRVADAMSGRRPYGAPAISRRQLAPLYLAKRLFVQRRNGYGHQRTRGSGDRWCRAGPRTRRANRGPIDGVATWSGATLSTSRSGTRMTPATPSSSTQRYAAWVTHAPEGRKSRAEVPSAVSARHEPSRPGRDD
jgi:hypothetical protein